MNDNWIMWNLTPISAEPSTEKAQTLDILKQTPNVRYRNINGKLYRIVYKPIEAVLNEQ